MSGYRVIPYELVTSASKRAGWISAVGSSLDKAVKSAIAANSDLQTQVVGVSM